MLRFAIELCQAAFNKIPERSNIINMFFTPGKFVIAMLHTVVLIIAHIKQSIIVTLVVIGRYCGIWGSMPTHNSLQCHFGTILHYLCLDLALAFQHTRYNCNAVGAATALIVNTLRVKMKFIDFYCTLKWRFKFTRLHNSQTLF